MKKNKRMDEELNKQPRCPICKGMLYHSLSITSCIKCGWKHDESPPKWQPNIVVDVSSIDQTAKVINCAWCGHDITNDSRLHIKDDEGYYCISCATMRLCK